MRVAKANERPAAEPAHAADRFAREIVPFLTVFVVRSRRLMGNPLGRHSACIKRTARTATTS
jgi:hypothetical protein